MKGAVALGAMVVCTHDWHPAVTPHFREVGGLGPRPCVRGTRAAELQSLSPAPDAIVRKGENQDDGYSGFGVRPLDRGELAPSDLAHLLSRHGVVDVFVVGLALDVCLKATALDATDPGLRTSSDQVRDQPSGAISGRWRPRLAELAAAASRYSLLVTTGLGEPVEAPLRDDPRRRSR